VQVYLLAARPGRTHYLLLHRLPFPQLGLPAFWQGVSGTVKAKESPADAARREILTKTGLAPLALVDTEVRHAFPIRPEWRDRHPSDSTEITEHLFVAWIDPGASPRLSAKHDIWRWCDTTEAAELLTFGHNADCLRTIERHLDDFQI